MFKSLIFFLILSLLSFGAKFAYDKYMLLNAQILSLKTLNSALTRKQVGIKKRLKSRRGMLVKRKLKRAKYKIARAPAGMVPFLGAGAIVGFTAYEINEYCEDIKEYKKFEESISGPLEDETTDEELLLCGLNVEESLLPELEKYGNSSKSWIVENYNDLKKRYSH